MDITDAEKSRKESEYERPFKVFAHIDGNFWMLVTSKQTMEEAEEEAKEAWLAHGGKNHIKILENCTTFVPKG
jgi:hypothetical protein